MSMRQNEATRRAKPTALSISPEDKQNAELAATAAAAAYDQAVADLSTATLDLDRTVIRAPAYLRHERSSLRFSIGTA